MPLTGKKELLPEHELLYNFDQHVRHCPFCSKVPLHISPCISTALMVITQCACVCKLTGQSVCVLIKATTSSLGEHARMQLYQSRHLMACLIRCADGLQALVTLERVRHLVAGAGALCMLGMSALLGKGAALNSAGVLGLTAGVAHSRCTQRMV